MAAQNGLLTGYKIRFKKSGADNSDTVTTDGHLQTYAITGRPNETNSTIVFALCNFKMLLIIL